MTIDFPGSSSTQAYGINNAGDIVGTYGVSDPSIVVHSHGFLLSNGHFTTIDFPGSFGTEAYGINTAGQIVGVYWDARGAAFGLHGFLLSAGRFTSIDRPHAVTTRVFGINDGGQIVGAYTVKAPSAIPGADDGGVLSRLFGRPPPGYDFSYGHGFVYANGRFTLIDVPGAALGEQTLTSGINAAGQIVGSYFDGKYAHGFMLTNGNYVNLDSVGSPKIFPSGVNKADQVVGDCRAYGPGFLWNQGQVTVIDFKHVVPDTFMTMPCAINDSGQIVGYYEVTSRVTATRKHGFILNPDR